DILLFTVNTNYDHNSSTIHEIDKQGSDHAFHIGVIRSFSMPPPSLYSLTVSLLGEVLMALVSNASSHYMCSDILHQRHERTTSYDMAYLEKCGIYRDKFFNTKDGLRNLSCSLRSSEKKHVTSFYSFTGRKRLDSTIVAASPPTEDVVVAAEPLTKEDLVSYLSSGCKPKEQWRIGTEHEKFGFKFETLRPMRYDQIANLLEGIAERFDWEKVMEGDKIIGPKQGKQSISLEPGGQFELSGAPLETLHQTCAEVNSHLYQVKAVAEEMGIGFLGIGFQPKWWLKDIPIMPKGRYEIMRRYMPKVGTLGLDMMFRTCTVQVNLDFSSEHDMIRKFRAGLALQPIATAIFANSPFKEGKPNGFLSMRRFEQYVEYALDVPMYFVYRKKKYIDCSGMSFRDFMIGKLPPIPGELPTVTDWENHLTTIFPEGQIKTIPGDERCRWRTLASIVGLLYDEVSLQKVLDLTSDWTAEERQMLRSKVPRTGLQTPFRDSLVKHIAEEVVKLARDGLERRGYKETGFLNEVDEVVRTGTTPAEKLLKLYHEKWEESVDPVFEELLY
ncbi:Glutamate--cysteine ligase, partial [Nymphaea thermarum]